MMKKDFAAPHDIIRHMRMEDVLEYAITTVPGLKLLGQNDDRKVSRLKLAETCVNVYGNYFPGPVC